jgi:hypothetical protein
MVATRKYEYKYVVFGNLLHEEVYSHLEAQHRTIIDVWLSGMLNDWEDVDATRNGHLIHVSTARMKQTFSIVEEYYPNVYEDLATIIELVEEHFSQDHVRASDGRETLERLEDAFNEWRSLAVARAGR